MKRILRREWIALGLASLLALLPLIALGVYVMDVRRAAQARIAELEPRHARLAGLVAGRAALDKAEAAAREQLGERVYPATQDLTQAGNDAQQRVRTVFTNAGLQLVSSQVLPAKDEKQFDRIPLMVRLEGDLTALQMALIALPQQTPAILLDGLNIQSMGVTRPEQAQRLASQFNLSVLRLKP